MPQLISKTRVAIVVYGTGCSGNFVDNLAKSLTADGKYVVVVSVEWKNQILSWKGGYKPASIVKILNEVSGPFDVIFVTPNEYGNYPPLGALLRKVGSTRIYCIPRLAPMLQDLYGDKHSIRVF